MPILFHHPEAGDLGGTVYFHPQWWYAVAVELELPQADGSIVYRQIKPQPQDEITLLFEHLKKDGTIGWATGRRMPWGNGPELLLGLQPPGTYVFGVTAEAIGGKAASAFYQYRLGEDAGLAAFMKQGADFELDDLLGTWEMIEPEALAGGGRIVPNGILVQYERHPEKPALMISTMTAPQRVILIVQGNQFQVNQFGMAIDVGVFAIQGDTLTTQSSFTGVVERFRVVIEGNVLRLQDEWGALYVYQRVQ